jgi:hypothetical protein
LEVDALLEVGEKFLSWQDPLRMYRVLRYRSRLDAQLQCHRVELFSVRVGMVHVEVLSTSAVEKP